MAELFEPLERAWASSPDRKSWPFRKPKFFRGDWLAIRVRIACWLVGLPWSGGVSHTDADGEKQSWELNPYWTNPALMLYRLRGAHAARQKKIARERAQES